jgi:NADP-dependent 3-hydroxy acid dehydrogenase YdfG
LIAARDRDKGLKAREKLRRHGFDVHSTLLDVTDPMSIQAAVGRIKDEFERLDILVNNAGIMIDSQTGISELDEIEKITNYKHHLILKLGFVVWDLQYFKAHYVITPTLHDRFKFFLT